MEEQKILNKIEGLEETKTFKVRELEWINRRIDELKKLLDNNNTKQ